LFTKTDSGRWSPFLCRRSAESGAPVIKSWLAVFGSVLLAVIVVEPCVGQQNVTAPGGVAVGGSILNSPIEIKGVPAETLPGIIEATTKGWRDLSDQQKQTIDTLQNKLGVNENALKAFFAILGEKEVPSEQLLPARNRQGQR
jgi:hypothetical protein